MTGDELLRRFRRSAWRLETLPAYGTPETDPSFARWLELGGQVPPLDERPTKQAWMTRIAATVAEGRSMSRVRIVQRPLSLYGAYELATDPENLAAGEDVRIAELDEHPELAALLGRDFWLLDDSLAVLMRYDAAGRFQRSQPSRDRAVVGWCRQARALVTAAAVPLEEYLTAA